MTSVTAETLFLWGAEDEFQPIDYADRLSEPIDDTKTVGIDGASHWVPEDRSDGYREELLAFLD